MTPMTSSGAIFGSKISNTLFLYFFWPPKKISKKLARAENFDPIFDPLLTARHHFWGVDPIFKKCPRGNLGSVQSLKKIVCAVFLVLKNLPILENSIFQAPTGSYTGACVTIGQNEISFQSFLFTSFKKRLKSKFFSAVHLQVAP